VQLPRELFRPCRAIAEVQPADGIGRVWNRLERTLGDFSKRKEVIARIREAVSEEEHAKVLVRQDPGRWRQEDQQRDDQREPMGETRFHTQPPCGG